MTIRLADQMLVKAVDCEGIKQLDDKGQGVAVIATLNVIDKDQDMTQPGAFGGGQTVPMVPAHNWQHVPIGKGRIFEEGNEVLIAFQLNMKLGFGRAWNEAFKFDLENPPAKQQWSYGFSLLDSGFGEHEGQPVRFLKSIRVHEVSPVILGAGINTRTLALKSGALWLSIEAVERLFPECGKAMRAKGWRKVNIAALKQGFTCPKPFATFQECVDRFTREGDIADPEAFCAAWEEFCGERAAEAEAEKALAMTRKLVQEHWARRERAIRGLKM